MFVDVIIVFSFYCYNYSNAAYPAVYGQFPQAIPQPLAAVAPSQREGKLKMNREMYTISVKCFQFYPKECRQEEEDKKKTGEGKIEIVWVESSLLWGILLGRASSKQCRNEGTQQLAMNKWLGYFTHQACVISKIIDHFQPINLMTDTHIILCICRKPNSSICWIVDVYDTKSTLCILGKWKGISTIQ